MINLTTHTQFDRNNFPCKVQKGQFLVDLDNLSLHEHNKKGEIVINREMPISICTGIMSGGPLSCSERVGMYSRHAGGEADCFQPARPHNMGSGHLKEEWE